MTRKVIFYNTTISGLLSGDMAYLKKIRATLAFFRERKDVVLLWRPHPLNEATYQSMRPELLDAYKQIIFDYQQAGWGIYDDTPELHRAIAISDAYYGDMSSVVPLFIATGKPVMIQNIHEYHSSEPYILPTCLYIDDEFIWFTICGKNGLFRMDKRTGKSKFVANFPGFFDNGYNIFYNTMAKVSDTMYFTPGAADSIVMYNLTDKSFASVNINPPSMHFPEVEYNETRKFHNVFVYKNKVFFIGCSYPGIVCLDTLKGKIEYYTEWVSEFVGQLEPGGCDLLFASCRGPSVIMAVSFFTNSVLSFDLETCQAMVHKISDKVTGWTDICFDGTYYWLTPKNEIAIVRWNFANNEVVEFRDFPDNLESREYCFRKIICTYDNIWLFPFKGNMVLKVNKHSGRVTIVREFNSVPDAYSWYFSAHLYGEKIYAIPVQGNVIEEYDVKSDVLTMHTVRVEDISTEVADVNKTTPTSLLYREGGWLSMNQFLNLVNSNTLYSGSVQQNGVSTFSINRGSAGRNIYDFIKAKSLL